jgi:hypothetical protein
VKTNLGLLLCGFSLAIANENVVAQMATAFSYEVSSSGAAGISVPIELPPGVAGLVPTLALTYNSQAPNGIAGVGWNFGGLSSISRCNTPGNVGYGVPRAVNYTQPDAYCVDGVRLLADVFGTHGAPGMTYRTESDSFRRFTCVGVAGSGPESFLVRTKEGYTIEYGATADSRVAANGRADIAVWQINRIVDRNGNHIKFSYSTTATDSVPTLIEYGGNANSNTPSVASVVLGYRSGTRSDSSHIYQGGALSEKTRILESVKTFSGSTLVREYKLAHTLSLSTWRNTLTEIQECDGAANCRLGLKASYAAATNGLSGVKSTGMSGTWASPAMMHVGDFNGDGKADVAAVQGSKVVIHAGSSTMASVANWPVSDEWGPAGSTWVGDFNADGRADLASAAGAKVHLKISNGGSFSSQSWTVDDSWGNAEFTFVGDFNGDGTTDIASALGGIIYLKSSNGKKFESTRNIVEDKWGSAGYTWVGDFNGDGMSDIASASGSSVYMKLATGSGFRSETWSISGPWGNSDFTWVADFNGDGLSDIASASGSTVYVRLSKGVGGFDSKIWSLPTSTWGTAGYTRLGDFNSDGLADILTIVGASAYVRLSTGKSFVQEIWNLPTSVGDSDLLWVSDFDGDGRTDLVSGAGENAYINTPSGGSDRIAQAGDTKGMSLDFSYTTPAKKTPIADARPVKADGKPLRLPIPVVETLILNANKSNSRTIRYNYGSGYFDFGRRGFLGFSSLHAFDDVNKTVESTYFRLDHPYIGQPDEISVRPLDETGTPKLYALHSTKFTYRCIFSGSGSADADLCTSWDLYHHQITWPYPAMILNESYEYPPGQAQISLPKKKIVVESTDQFGNPLSTKTLFLNGDGTPSGYAQAEEFVYNNDAGAWEIAKLVRRTTTKVSP